MMTMKGIEEGLWFNDSVRDVSVGHWAYAMFSGSQRYHSRIEFIGDRNFCIKCSMLGEDVIVNKLLVV